jgi:hypothetical protein
MTNSTVMASVQEEHDGKDGILGNQAGGTFYHGTAAEYRAFFNKVRTLGKTHCPDVKFGQIVADADRLASCLVPEADFYGSDPHFYGWTSDGKPTGGTFAQRLETLATRLEQAGVGDKPFIINVGGVERAGDPTAKAGYISDMADVLKTAHTDYPNLLYATWWDRGTEAVDTSPQSLEAFRKCFA